MYQTVTMKRQPAANSLIQPVSMEDREHYLDRFAAHKGMTSLFNDESQRREVAATVFAERWESAQVTVRKLDGTMFFID